MTDQRIDHINIRIPKDGVEAALEFYVDLLGFEPLKLDAYRADERTSFFVRIGETSVINVRPVETFQEPSGENLDHFCLIVDESIEELKPRLEEHGVEILREGTPYGATGRAPAVYVTDPFGFKIELKEPVE